MILTNRLFERAPPSREAKSIYIFCEGVKREVEYFDFFKELDSRINIEVYKLHPHDNNSPTGLLSIAEKCIVASDDNPGPKYNFIEGDEVWIVLDTDKDATNSREIQILDILKKCKGLKGWNLAQSNPCFEVWLYYHFSSVNPELSNKERCSAWKPYVGQVFTGGFDSRKHPIYIKTACRNAENTFKESSSTPDLGCTSVYNLGNSILKLVGPKIQKVLNQIKT